MERLTFMGQPNCLRLANGDVDVILTTQIGPRILRYGFQDGANVLGLVPEVSQKTALGEWKPWGGHRVWVAPEWMPGSYAPDNSPIAAEADTGRSVVLRQPTDAAGIDKRLRVSLAPAGTCVTVEQTITNRTVWGIRAASWAITIVAPGRAVVPQPPHVPHGERLQPARPLVLWSFTDLSDRRYRLGKRLLQLRTDADSPSPQKIGAANELGWCASIHDDLVFVKRFGCEAGAEYPDFGCNNELYTAAAYLEMETLGPIRLLAPGESASHTERWHLFQGAPKGEDDATTAEALAAMVAQTD